MLCLPTGTGLGERMESPPETGSLNAGPVTGMIYFYMSLSSRFLQSKIGCS